jgi:NAD(P)-dependent dehydrogenase (short-subunit alcohol dehydrogenase family)
MPIRDSLEDRIALVTGAGAGLGAAIARRLSSDGATVVVSDIDYSAAQYVADSIEGAVAIAADVTEEDQVRSLVEQTVDRFGALHIAVPNAGVGAVQPIAEMSYADWRKITAVDLDGVFLTIRYAAPAIAASGGGTIVTISSITATAGSAVEFRDHGVRVNAVLPGFIDTELVTTARPHFETALGLPAGGFDDLIASKQGRYGTPEEVAAAVAFFASSESSWCTGSSLVLDGGLVASLF